MGDAPSRALGVVLTLSTPRQLRASRRANYRILTRQETPQTLPPLSYRISNGGKY